MAKAAPLQSSFNAGELSPLLQGRVDAERYKSGLALCKNWIPSLQGFLSRRGGAMYIEKVKTSSNFTRIVPFQFSVTQSYVLEFGDQYIRIYQNYGQVISGGVAYEVTTPYLTAELSSLRFVQSADVLYIFHSNHAPQTLSRLGQTNWQLAAFGFQDGPYLPINADSSSMISSTQIGTTNNFNITSVKPIFALTDFGRWIRVLQGSNWITYKIFNVHSTTSVDASFFIGPTLAAFTNVANWRLGTWSDTTGYPGCGNFHEDRLMTAGLVNYPQRFDGSKSGDYVTFRTTGSDGTVAPDDSLSFNLNSNELNLLEWLMSDEQGLLAGSSAGEWMVRPSSQGEALTPTNINARKTTSYGSASIQPVQAGKATIFVQRGSRKLRELMFFWDIDGYRATDLTELSEHITGTGITQIAFCNLPQPIVWCVRNDGALVGMTYDRDAANLRVAWHWHQLGGQSDAAGTPPVVESITVIPSPDLQRDDLWMVVKRWINGQVVRTIEVLTKCFEEVDEQYQAYLLDCGLTYDQPLAITGITQASPAVVTVAAHGLSNGDRVVIRDITGMTDLNDKKYTVAGATTNTFQLTKSDGTPIDSTAFKPYTSGGTARKLVSTISGLGYLEGETVSIYADGAVLTPQVVTGGQITLPSSAGTVSVGYGYNSDGQQLRLEAGSQNGTALGKTRRTNRVGLLLNRTLGMKIGFSFDNLTTIHFRNAGDPGSLAPSLFTGIKSETVESDYDFDNQFCFRVDQPVPATILAIMPQLETEDRG